MILLTHVFVPVFKKLLYRGHELIGDGAIDNAMIVAEREVNDRANGDGIRAVFVGNHHGLFGDSADAHYRYIRLVDDRQAENGAKLAWVCNGESRTFNVRRHKLL